MHTKIRIDLSQGIIDIEGDDEFVREVYGDLRDSLIRKVEGQESMPDEKIKSDPETVKKPVAKQRPTSRKKAANETNHGQPDPDNPRLDKDLDLSRLATFYGQFEPSNHPERILLFAKFLKDELDLDAITTDHIFTCYMGMREHVPEAFKQSFRDAHGNRYGYINFSDGSNVDVSVSGENHFNHKIKRKDPE